MENCISHTTSGPLCTTSILREVPDLGRKEKEGGEPDYDSSPGADISLLDVHNGELYYQQSKEEIAEFHPGLMRSVSVTPPLPNEVDAIQNKTGPVHSLSTQTTAENIFEDCGLSEDLIPSACSPAESASCSLAPCIGLSTEQPLFSSLHPATSSEKSVTEQFAPPRLSKPSFMPKNEHSPYANVLGSFHTKASHFVASQHLTHTAGNCTVPNGQINTFSCEPDSQFIIPPSPQGCDTFAKSRDFKAAKAHVYQCSGEAHLCSSVETLLTKSPVEDQPNSAYSETKVDVLREES